MKKHVQGFSVLFLFLFLIFTSAFQAFGQNIQISGKVTDASTGQTLPGVSILVKNTTV
ncbi:MAG TPA: TonB-denpendent receptor, partial [Ignavibacteria bacterium]|nr:TonB-denpendent receptor [Ignavibacteria bacterium]